ncbi:hypothetical protein [Shewanella sp. 1180_01]|uniref:hypothetical protein n=1 Tax=Shewanella sp. 1180_01 TaxID=2604451 RepID=UPI004063A320
MSKKHMKEKTISLLALSIISSSVFASSSNEFQALTLRYDKQLTEIGLNSDNGFTKGLAKYDRIIIDYMHLANYDWGSNSIIIQWDDPFAMGSGNSFLNKKGSPSKGVGAYASFRAFLDTNINIENSDFSLWSYNYFISNEFMVESNNYFGLSYEININDFIITPKIGYNITINQNNPFQGAINPITGQYVDYGTKVIRSGAAVITANKNFKFKNFEFNFNAFYESQFGRSSEYNSYAANLNDSSYGHLLRLGVQIPLSKSFSYGITLQNIHNFGGYGNNANTLELNASCSF